MYQYGVSDVVYSTQCWVYQIKLLVFLKIVFPLIVVYNSNI